MSGRSSKSRCSRPELELKLNLSPPRPAETNSNYKPVVKEEEWPEISSEEGSCLVPETGEESCYSCSPETTSSSLVLVGCVRCMMYAMINTTSDEVEPKCPKCKSTVLLRFLNQS